MSDSQCTLQARPDKAAKSWPYGVTVVEVRRGKGPKPPFRVVGVTSTDPAEAVMQMSDAVRVGIKTVREFEDGYCYGIPALDNLPTQVRATRFGVTEVASMVTNTMKAETMKTA